MKKFLFLLILLTGSDYSFAQVQTRDDVSVVLENLFIRLRQNYPPETKTLINDSIRVILDEYSVSDTVFDHRFSNLRFLGQATSTDSLVKIITWNMVVANGSSSYYCNVIKRDGKGTPARLFRLKADYKPSAFSLEKTYLISDWYGALYYDIRPFNYNGNVKYVVLGIDYGNSFITRKVIDVLSFEGSEGIQFGLKCFTDGKNVSQRILFEYSSSAVMSLRFESDDFIVFDHLSPFSPENKGNRQFYGPDFSFDAYRFEKGLWWLKSDIDIKNR